MKKQAIAALALVVPMLMAGAALWVSAEPFAEMTALGAAANATEFHTWTELDPAYEGGRSGCRRRTPPDDFRFSSADIDGFF